MPEVSEVVVAEFVAVFVAVVELPLALVTPEQPLRNAPNTTMKAAKIRDELRRPRSEPRFSARVIIRMQAMDHRPLPEGRLGAVKSELHVAGEDCGEHIRWFQFS